MKFITAILILLSVSTASAEMSREAARKAVTSAEWAEGVTLHDYDLVDQDRRGFHLKEYFGKGRPLLVSFIYTSCSVECPTISNTLLAAVKEVKNELGDRFDVLTIGYDTERDTPERLKEYGKNFADEFDTFRFATGGEDTVKRLAKEFGFYYEKSDGGFSHLNMVSVVDAEGRIYKQVYTSRIGTEDVRRPLRELITGQIHLEQPPTLLDRIKQFCTEYDPVSGRYSLNYPVVIGIFLQISGVLIISYLIATPRFRTFMLKPQKMEVFKMSTRQELDVVNIIPKERHPLIFKTFDELKNGESFILINDHDPKPLYYQFLHEREGQFSWEYQKQGPDLWKVKISKV